MNNNNILSKIQSINYSEHPSPNFNTLNSSNKVTLVINCSNDVFYCQSSKYNGGNLYTSNAPSI